MIFCSKCGAQLNDDAAFCPTCGAQVAPVADAQPVVAAQPVDVAPAATVAPELDPSTANHGLGKAITSAIFAFLAGLFALIGNASSLSAQLILGVLSIPFFVLAICLGAPSIGNYKEARTKFNRNPLATLILGAVSLAIGVICCLAFNIFLWNYVI